MSDSTKFQEFLDFVEQTPLPDSQIERAKRFVREYAMGINMGLWGVEIPYLEEGYGYDNVYHFITKRWNLDDFDETGDDGNFQMFIYLTEQLGFTKGMRLTKLGLDLLSTNSEARSFISYKREASSALALLVLNRLKQAGIDVFLDMSISVGDDWQQRIKSEIYASTHFILLLAPKTLDSDVVKMEIDWAIESKKIIIPIWHNGFNLQSLTTQTNIDSIRETLQQKNAIKVLEESALEYNTRVTELLNLFGLTP